MPATGENPKKGPNRKSKALTHHNPFQTQETYNKECDCACSKVTRCETDAKDVEIATAPYHA